MNHAERARRRESIVADLLAGIRPRHLAKRHGLTLNYVYLIAKRAGVSLAKAPRPDSETHILAKRRRAAVLELASLDITRTKIASLLGLERSYVGQICKAAQVDPPREESLLEPIRQRSRERAQVMATLYRDGFTLEQIGQQYQLTRERVRQLLKKYCGMDARDGGQHVLKERAEAKRIQKRNAKSLRRWGCSWEQYVALRKMKKPTRAYSQQRKNAQIRGIGWEFTLWTWWTTWQASGKWAQRGRGQGYVMCRQGDTGPYSPENVFIALAAQNSSDGQARKRKHHDLPIGVRRTASGRYTAQRRIRGVELHFPTFDTPELAYAAYLAAGSANNALNPEPTLRVAA